MSGWLRLGRVTTHSRQEDKTTLYAWNPLKSFEKRLNKLKGDLGWLVGSVD